MGADVELDWRRRPVCLGICPRVPTAPRSFGGHPVRGVRMNSPAGRSGIVVTAVLSWWMLLGGPTFGQEDGTAPAASPFGNRPVRPGDSSNFDAGQETPAPPVT